MELSLILMRHAKSSWDDPTLDDFERPLNPRGRKSARAIGSWLTERGYLPEDVIVSGARRTVETWSRMAEDMPKTAVMRSEPALYHASEGTMLGILRNSGARSVMMIGHNPGIAEFAASLSKNPPNDPRFDSYPTGATCVYRFSPDSWSQVGRGDGTVVDFVVPRDLLDG